MASPSSALILIALIKLNGAVGKEINNANNYLLDSINTLVQEHDIVQVDLAVVKLHTHVFRSTDERGW